jgi:uncharacterized membrane protein (UPF0127 family)
MTSFLSALHHDPNQALMLVGPSDSQPIARHIETAFSRADRRRGLLGRLALDRDSALVIAPCWSVHTFHMRFTIDVVFVTRAGTVLALSERLPPWRLAARWGAYAAIELPEGAVERSGIRRGDGLRLVGPGEQGAPSTSP